MIVYLLEQGVEVTRHRGRIVVKLGDEIIRSYPEGSVERLIVFGNVRLTPQVISYLLKKGIEVLFLSANGTYRGRLQGKFSKNVELRLLQYEKFKDSSFKLSVSKEFVRGKIRNSITLLQRYNWDIKSEEIRNICSKLRSFLMRIDFCETVDSLMGLEGASANLYFKGLNLCVKNEIFTFPSRSRRPPEDPANAVLSFLYTLLSYTVESSVYKEGLDPYVGFFHAIDYGRPSLVLDLMEEFRPLMDRIFLKLSNKKMLLLGDFRFLQYDEEDSSGVYLTFEGMKKVIAEFQEQLKKRFLGRVIDQQVHLLAKAIKGEEKYTPYLLRA